jgi:PhzF family phenazine biosynthesis protein
MRAPLFQIDAFASKAFQGNPAAVCPLSSWPEAALLQQIAAENNLSETAFLVPRGGDFEIRWFTPTVEVDLCGHATLASAHVLFRHLQPGRTHVVFHSRSGELPVAQSGSHLELSFPALPASPVPLTEAFVRALGARPRELHASAGDYLAVFDSEAQVRALAPDLVKVAALDRSGVIVTAAGSAVDFVSRYFAPRDGIPEDPVTGSAHCTLAPYWGQRLGKTALSARQVSARGGELRCRLANERVLIAGEAVTYLVGEVSV